MKKIFYILISTFFITSVNAADIILSIRSNIDGDSIRSTLNLPCPLCNISVRMRDIGAPDYGARARSEKEAKRAKEAKKFVASSIDQSKTIVVKDVAWDKYGGRVNGYVFINNIDVGKVLIDKGFAKPYTSQGPSPIGVIKNFISLFFIVC